MGLFPSTDRRWDETWAGRHSLSLTLVVLMTLQTLYAVWSGAHVWEHEQPYGDLPAFTGDFWVWWSWEYNVSLVADTFGVLLIVLLGQLLYEDGANEGKDHGATR